MIGNIKSVVDVRHLTRARIGIKMTIGTLRDVEVTVSDGVLFQELDGELVLLSMESGEYFSLNEVGAKIWVLITADWSIPDILKSFINQFDASEEQLAADIEVFLKHLLDHKLISVVRTGA